jgi:riboflavin kinase/FMN adenylyltransferase
LRLAPDCGLRHGIYAVTLKRASGDRHQGVASFGLRPTFGGGEPLLEVFVFDFAADLYGEEVAVTFHQWLRPEEAFATPEALVAAMTEDSRRARAALAAAGEGSPLDRALTQIG